VFRRWNKYKVFGFATAIVLAANWSISEASAENLLPSTKVYQDAVAAMEKLPQPSFLTFHTSVKSSGMRFVVGSVPNRKDHASFAVIFGRSTNLETSWLGRYRAQDNRSMIVQDGKPPLIVSSPLFNPTWLGANDWLKNGLFSESPDAQATPTPLSTIAPTATSSPEDIRVIGRVVAVNSKDYIITRGPSESCPGDTAASDHLHLVAKNNAEAHPLTDVVVNSAGLFCTMRFSLGARSALSFRGAFRLDFGMVDKFWLVRSGTADFAIRALGISTLRSHVVFSYLDYDVPPSLPITDFGN